MPLAYGLIDPCELFLPDIPQAVDGLRLAHVADLHVTPRFADQSRLIHQLARQRLDMVCLTGDYMTRRGRGGPAPGVAALRKLCDDVRPRLGFVGVFGNHDSAELRDQVRDLPIRWLENQAVRLDASPVDVWGLDAATVARDDGAALAMQVARLDRVSHPASARGEAPLRLMLHHYPAAALLAGHLRAHLLLCGHTHGGQIRLPGKLPLHNSSELPLHMSAGLLRHRRTTIAISRGIGYHTVPLRIHCPPHIPVYTLRRGPTVDAPDARVICYQRW